MHGLHPFCFHPVRSCLLFPKGMACTLYSQATLHYVKALCFAELSLRWGDCRVQQYDRLCHVQGFVTFIMPQGLVALIIM
jgi:hypothetical protein